MSLVLSWPSVLWIGAAQILLKFIDFVKKFIKPLFILRLESNLIEWCDHCIENCRENICEKMDYRFK